MNEQLENKFSEDTIDLIINAAYGSASFIQKVKVWFLIKENTELKELYEEYKSTAHSVHTLNNEELPEIVLQKIETKTEVNLTEKENSFLGDLTSILFEKPQIIFATSAIVIGLVISSMLFKQTNIENNSPYTATEIQRANKQAKQALALVGKILNSTETTLTEEIIPNKVVKPLNKSFDYVNELLKNGEI